MLEIFLSIVCHIGAATAVSAAVSALLMLPKKGVRTLFVGGVIVILTAPRVLTCARSPRLVGLLKVMKVMVIVCHTVTGVLVVTPTLWSKGSSPVLRSSGLTLATLELKLLMVESIKMSENKATVNICMCRSRSSLYRSLETCAENEN